MYFYLLFMIYINKQFILFYNKNYLEFKILSIKFIYFI